MNKRTLYTIIAVLVAVGLYTFEFYLDSKEKAQYIEVGKTPKKYTNTYFLPTSTADQNVHHQNYSLSYSEPHEQAEWVAYELKASHLSTINHQRPYFEIDKAIKTGAAHWRNYKNSGYDRGHLCPAGDRRFSKEAYDETFLTSNISPQEHEFNAGVWNRLEQKVRYWAKKNDGVYVVTGAILTHGLKTIGEEAVAVPQQFYKIILAETNGNYKVLAFLLDHKDSDLPLYKFVVSVDDIESLTGIDFFSKLDDAIENRLEASRSYKDWSF